MSSESKTVSEPRELLTFSATMRPEKVTMPRAVDFRRLSRPVQERFAAATRGTAPPGPLLFRRAPRAAAWRSLGSSAVLALIALLLWRAGWGDLGSPLAIHGLKMLALDVVLFCGFTYGIVHAAAFLRAVGGMPYRAGTYLFPACLVEAHGPVLRVWSLGDAQVIERMTGPSPGLALRMCDGSRVVVPAGSAAEAERAEAALASLRPALMRALTEEDARVLVELDPLHDGALSNPFGPTESMKRVVPAWTRFDWALAVGMGVVLGLAVVKMRNATSDEAMFGSVAAAASVPEYERYLSHGGQHSSDIRSRLLPMAELRDAEAQGNIEALRASARAHPSSIIGPQIDAAMRRVLLARLEEVKSLGTVGAIDEFQRSYPDSKLDSEIAIVRHAIYARALATWEDKTHPGATTAALMSHLLGWAEKNTQPTLEVRFQLRPSKTLADADTQVTKSVRYPGPDALPSRCLTLDAMEGREQGLALEVARAFAQNFASDLLSVRAGGRLAAGAAAPTDAPALIITYAPEWAFTTELSDSPETVFAGLQFAFEASFVVPDEAPLAIESHTWHAPQPWKTKIRDDESRQDYEQRVYDIMIDDAFDKLTDKVTSTLF